MEKQILYTQVSAENAEHCHVFEMLMYAYIAELNQHLERPLPEPFQQKWIHSIIAMQGPCDRHLELCYVDGEAIGFLYGKIDHEDHKGYIKPGYGYIMEFYVKSEHRRNGYGRNMFRRLENLFRADGASRMYLTADPVTGKPFWEAMGFQNTQEKSPENQLYLYERPISGIDFARGRLMPLDQNVAEIISTWVYETPYDVYNFKGASDDWLMDTSTWGTEQFCLMDGERILGQVSCQLDGTDLWVGWSMAPHLCGKGTGSEFVAQCVKELRALTNHTGRILLRVAAWNRRAIRAYEKAGFTYVETIQDEIAYSNHMEDFWVMALQRPVSTASET